MKSEDSQLAIYASLETYEKSIESLFEAIEFAAPNANNNHQNMLNQAIDSVIHEDETLAVALDEVYSHRVNSQKIAELKSQCAECDRKLEEMLRSLAAMQKQLLMSSKVMESEPEIIQERVDYDALIKYAEWITKYSQPPHDLDPTLLLSALPSLPWTEDVIRDMRKTSLQARPIDHHTNGQGQDHKVDVGQVQQNSATDYPNYQVQEPTQDVRNQEAPAAPAPTNAVALDLDLFDPDEDE